jgi:hypothetical protein
MILGTALANQGLTKSICTEHVQAATETAGVSS